MGTRLIQSIHSLCRSLVQIKSHAQKVLKRQDSGEDIFHRLEDNKARADLLVSRAHARLGGEPSASNLTTKRRRLLASEYDVDAANYHREESDADEDESEDNEERNVNQTSDQQIDTNQTLHQKSPKNDGQGHEATVTDHEKENQHASGQEEGKTTDEEAFRAADEDASSRKGNPSRSTFMDAASALCQLVSKDNEGGAESEQFDSSTTIGLAPTPMKSFAEAHT